MICQVSNLGELVASHNKDCKNTKQNITMTFFAENCLLQDSCKFHLDFLVEDRAGFPIEFTLSVSISTCNIYVWPSFPNFSKFKNNQW